MNNKTIATVLIILVIVVGGALVWYFMQDESSTTNTNTNTTTNTAPQVVREQPPANTVWIENGSFNPSVVTVSAGETVTWVNKDMIARKVASDPYPGNSDLPELLSDELQQDDSYTFTFTTAGEFGYHDDLNPIKKGKVIVE
ncbi:MAG: cupredoxin domain-containing protein [Patescibacteria group bacterium]